MNMRAQVGWMVKGIALGVAIGVLNVRVAAAQTTLSLSFDQASVPTPEAAEFVATASGRMRVTATVVCDHGPCTVSIRAKGSNAVNGPGGSITQLEYSKDGTTYVVVPSRSGSSLGDSVGSVSGTSGTVVFFLRYRVGWINTNGSAFYTPQGLFSLLVDISIAN
jgi:hypothetical protein